MLLQYFVREKPVILGWEVIHLENERISCMHRMFCSSLWPHRMPFIAPPVAGKLGGRVVINANRRAEECLGHTGPLSLSCRGGPALLCLQNHRSKVKAKELPSQMVSFSLNISSSVANDSLGCEVFIQNNVLFH